MITPQCIKKMAKGLKSLMSLTYVLLKGLGPKMGQFLEVLQKTA